MDSSTVVKTDTSVFDPTRVALKTGELGILLFKAGFKDLTRARVLIETLWAFNPLQGIKVYDRGPAVELSFSYVRVDNRNKAGVRVEYDAKQALVDAHLRFFIRKLRLLASGFALDVAVDAPGRASHFKLTLAKCYNLFVLDEERSWITVRKDDWSEVRKHLACYWQLGDKIPYSEHELDLAISNSALGWAEGKFETIECKDHWLYHKASVSMPTSHFEPTSIRRLARGYCKALHSTWRFIALHFAHGRTDIEVLRKTQIDD